jgi:hypothetical protein
VSNEDFFNPALRSLWKLETPATPTDTSKLQPSPSTPALTVGRTDRGLDSNLVTPVVTQPGGLLHEQSGLAARKDEHAVIPVWDSTIGIVRVSDALPQVVKPSSAALAPRDELPVNAPPGFGMTDAKSRTPRITEKLESRGEIVHSSDNDNMSNNNLTYPIHPRCLLSKLRSLRSL